MGTQDGPKLLGDIEASKEKSLKELGKLDFLKKIFDGAGISPGRIPVFACPVKPESMDLIRKQSGISAGGLDEVILSGTEVSLAMGAYRVDIAVCPKNLVAGLFDAKRLIASVVVTPKRKTTSALQNVFVKTEPAGIYEALLETFPLWTPSPLEDKSGSRIASVHAKNIVYANALFLAYINLPLEERLNAISSIVGLTPISLCSYILDGDIPEVDRKGISQLRIRLSADKKGVAGLWANYAHIQDTERRVRLVAADAGVDPVTVCGYLGLSDIPESEKSEVSALYFKLKAEKKGIAELWARYDYITDLGFRVRLVAADAGIDPVTACGYLNASSIPAGDKKGLLTLRQKLQAEKKDIAKFWSAYSGVSDFESRVRLVAEAAGIDPVSACIYLRASDILERDRKEIASLHKRLIGEKKDIPRLWMAYSKAQSLLDRVRLVAEAAGIDPTSACGYIECSVPEGERKGISMLRQKLQAEKKGIINLWVRYSDAPDLEARVLLVSRDADLDPVTTCGYLIVSTIPESERRGIPTLRNRLMGKKKEILKLWYTYSGVEDVMDRVRLVAADANIDPVTACNYLLASGIPAETGVSKLRSPFRMEAKGVARVWEKHNKYSTMARVRAVSDDVNLDPVTVCSQVLLCNMPADQKSAVKNLLQTLLEERRKVIDSWKKHTGKAPEARINLVASEVGVDPLTVCRYLLATNTSKGALQFIEKFKAERRGTAK